MIVKNTSDAPGHENAPSLVHADGVSTKGSRMSITLPLSSYILSLQ